MSDIRVYPTSCLSAYCGRGGSDCARCPHLPKRQEFLAWKERTKAVCIDEVWCPTVFEATQPDPEAIEEAPALTWPARIVKYLPGRTPKLEADNRTPSGQKKAQGELVRDFGFLLAKVPSPYQIPMEDFIRRVRAYSSHEKTKALCSLAEGSASSELIVAFTKGENNGRADYEPQ